MNRLTEVELNAINLIHSRDKMVIKLVSAYRELLEENEQREMEMMRLLQQVNEYGQLYHSHRDMIQELKAEIERKTHAQMLSEAFRALKE